MPLPIPNPEDLPMTERPDAFPATDPTRHQPLRPVTCAELTKQVGFEPTTRTGDNDWNFDCTNSIDLFARAPYGNLVNDYPGVTIARDSRFAVLYFYSRSS
ncbi:hypothetical protein [Nocardia sp. NPDC060259]|uniref:hypothetical protein n=1 Tax=Nocardia sp. NPDC060259 TaxID=3347088 RepID=UPI00365DE2CC